MLEVSLVFVPNHSLQDDTLGLVFEKVDKILSDPIDVGAWLVCQGEKRGNDVLFPKQLNKHCCLLLMFIIVSMFDNRQRTTDGWKQNGRFGVSCGYLSRIQCSQSIVPKLSRNKMKQ
jgi:hypothetical protein